MKKLLLFALTLLSALSICSTKGYCKELYDKTEMSSEEIAFFDSYIKSNGTPDQVGTIRCKVGDTKDISLANDWHGYLTPDYPTFINEITYECSNPNLFSFIDYPKMGPGFLMFTAKKTGMCVFTVKGPKEDPYLAYLFITVVNEDTDLPFTDVSPNDYFYNAVKWAYNGNITTGTSNTIFSPNGTCTRGQCATFLWRANGSPIVTINNPFTDVGANTYYCNPVKWAVANGITTGTSKTTFSPNGNCTRGQIVTFLWRAKGSPKVSGGNSFTDVPSSAYYFDAVNWAVANGITTGTSKTTFSPNNDCTRGQIVTFLFRCYGVNTRYSK